MRDALAHSSDLCLTCSRLLRQSVTDNKKHRAMTQMHSGRNVMNSFLRLLAAASIVSAGTIAAGTPVFAQQAPIKIGVPTSIQLQVGRDTQNAVKLAIEEI